MKLDLYAEIKNYSFLKIHIFEFSISVMHFSIGVYYERDCKACNKEKIDIKAVDTGGFRIKIAISSLDVILQVLKCVFML